MLYMCMCIYTVYIIEDDALKEEIIEMRGVLEEYLAFDNRSEIKHMLCTMYIYTCTLCTVYYTVHTCTFVHLH